MRTPLARVRDAARGAGLASRLPVKALPGAAATVLLVAAVAGLSRVPYALGGEEQATLRLSWRLQGEAVEECRDLSPEELERLPVHMRAARTCKSRGVSYALEAKVDGQPLVRDVVHPAGARGDRPVYVLEDVPLAPGPHRVSVTFRRSDGSEGDPGLAFDGTLLFAPREVLLLTYDPGARRLFVREPE